MPAGERDHAQIRETYLDRLRRECDSVELGLDLEGKPQHWPWSRVCAGGDERRRRGRRTWPSGDVLAADTFKKRRQTAVLVVPVNHLASPLRWAWVPAHRAVDDADFTEMLPEKLVGRLPLLVRLRDWASHPEFLAVTPVDPCPTGNQPRRLARQDPARRPQRQGVQGRTQGRPLSADPRRCGRSARKPGR